VVVVPVEPTEKTVVDFWSTDKEPGRVNLYEEIATRFMAENPGIDPRIVAIDKAEVSQRISTAIGANRLPDIVCMGIERVSAFATDGILDEAAAEAVIASIGENDFRAGPLAMVADPESGMHPAVPADGWIQAIWYRTDVIEEAGLNAPIAWNEFL
jgi:multiple sugar transport system substrate-binding protein